MADYCTITDLKTRLWPPGVTPDFVDDNNLALIISSVSAIIDGPAGCNRRFDKDTVDQTRYYAPLSGRAVEIDDCVSITSLATDDNLDWSSL